MSQTKIFCRRVQRRAPATSSAKTLGFRTLWLLLLSTATSTAFSTCSFEGALAVSAFFALEDELSVACFFFAEDALSAPCLFAAADECSVSCFFTVEDGFPVFFSINADDEFPDPCSFASAGSFTDLRFFPAERAVLVCGPVAAEGVPPRFSPLLQPRACTQFGYLQLTACPQFSPL